MISNYGIHNAVLGGSACVSDLPPARQTPSLAHVYAASSPPPAVQVRARARATLMTVRVAV